MPDKNNIDVKKHVWDQYRKKEIREQNSKCVGIN